MQLDGVDVRALVKNKEVGGCWRKQIVEGVLGRQMFNYLASALFLVGCRSAAC